MATNQTYIISMDSAPANPLTTLNTAVNSFITSGIALGYINFQVQPVVVVLQSATGAGMYNYTVQINYYNPAIM